MKRFGTVALALLILTGCEPSADENAMKQDPVRPAKIATAISATADLYKTFPGVTEATRHSVLAFRVSGQIVELPVRAGQVLKEGELIARLDNASYRNTLADRQAKYALAKTEFERQKVLFEQKHVAKSRLDEARSSFEAAQAAYQSAKDDLSYTKLVAPYDGLISRLEVENFQNIQAKEIIARFQGNKEIDVVFNVPENLFVQLNKDNTNGGRVSVTFDSLPGQIFEALYREHESLPDASTRSYKVTVSMPLPEKVTVLPGMSVSVRLDLSQVYTDRASGVLLPLGAVFDEDGARFVWKLDENDTARKTPVEVAGIVGEKIRVTSGVVEEDRVIAVGVSHVAEGQKVRPLLKERGL